MGGVGWREGGVVWVGGGGGAGRHGGLLLTKLWNERQARRGQGKGARRQASRLLGWGPAAGAPPYPPPCAPLPGCPA